MENIKLVALDLDGTLLDSKKRAPLDFIPYVKSRKDINFILASGRQYYALQDDFKELENDATFIAENGSIIFKNGQMVYINKMKDEDVIECLSMLKGFDNIVPIVCGEKSAYMTGESEAAVRNARIYYHHLEIVDTLDEIHKKDSIIKLALFFENYDAMETAGRIIVNNNLLKCVSNKEWIDIQNKDVSKGEGIKFLQKDLGISKEESMCFGDYMNDYPMFKECKYCIAMENACNELKEIAYDITDSNDNDGVMKVLRKLK